MWMGGQNTAKTQRFQKNSICFEWDFNQCPVNADICLKADAIMFCQSKLVKKKKKTQFGKYLCGLGEN